MRHMYLGLGLPRYPVRTGPAPEELLVAKQSAKPELHVTCRSQQRTPLHRAMSARQLSGKPMMASRTSLAAIAGAARGGTGRLPWARPLTTPAMQSLDQPAARVRARRHTCLMASQRSMADLRGGTGRGTGPLGTAGRALGRTAASTRHGSAAIIATARMTGRAIPSALAAPKCACSREWCLCPRRCLQTRRKPVARRRIRRSGQPQLQPGRRRASTLTMAGRHPHMQGRRRRQPRRALQRRLRTGRSCAPSQQPTLHRLSSRSLWPRLRGHETGRSPSRSRGPSLPGPLQSGRAPLRSSLQRRCKLRHLCGLHPRQQPLHSTQQSPPRWQFLRLPAAPQRPPSRSAQLHRQPLRRLLLRQRGSLCRCRCPPLWGHSSMHLLCSHSLWCQSRACLRALLWMRQKRHIRQPSRSVCLPVCICDVLRHISIFCRMLRCHLIVSQCVHVPIATGMTV